MNTALKIGGYTLGLLAVFGAAVGIGAAVTPTETTTRERRGTSRGPQQTCPRHARRPRCGSRCPAG